MMRFGPKLEYRQAVLFRLVDVGAELFAMAATCARAEWLRKNDPAAADARWTSRLVLPSGARARRRKVPRAFAQRRHAGLPAGQEVLQTSIGGSSVAWSSSQTPDLR